MWKKHKTTIILIGMLLAGLSLLLYPSFSNYWNSFHATQAIASYAEETANLNEAEYDAMLQEARVYNQMRTSSGGYVLNDAEKNIYESKASTNLTAVLFALHGKNINSMPTSTNGDAMRM